MTCFEISNSRHKICRTFMIAHVCPRLLHGLRRLRGAEHALSVSSPFPCQCPCGWPGRPPTNWFLNHPTSQIWAVPIHEGLARSLQRSSSMIDHLAGARNLHTVPLAPLREIRARAASALAPVPLPEPCCKSHDHPGYSDHHFLKSWAILRGCLTMAQ